MNQILVDNELARSGSDAVVSERTRGLGGVLALVCCTQLFACAYDVDESTEGAANGSQVSVSPQTPELASHETFVARATPEDLAALEQIDPRAGERLRIERLEVGDGFIEFIDEEKALPNRGIGIVSSGAGTALAKPLIERGRASALEVFQNAAPEREAPARLQEDHAALAAAGLVPQQPRSRSEFEVPGEAGELPVVVIFNGECPQDFDFDFWKTGWNVWSDTYGDAPQHDVVDNNVYLNSNTGFSHALGACNHATSACGTAGITGTMYGWTGAAWLYLSGPHSAMANGRSIYYGRSGFAIAKSRMVVGSVTSGCETVYVGANW